MISALQVSALRQLQPNEMFPLPFPFPVPPVKSCQTDQLEEKVASEPESKVQVEQEEAREGLTAEKKKLAHKVFKISPEKLKAMKERRNRFLQNKYHLQVDSKKKTGILILNKTLKTEKVDVLHICSQGDALIKKRTGKKVVMMINRKCVEIEEDEVVESKKRLEFVKGVCEAFSKGDIIDFVEVYFELHKWLL